MYWQPHIAVNNFTKNKQFETYLDTILIIFYLAWINIAKLSKRISKDKNITYLDDK